MNIQAALYDLDGLMVDSEPVHGVASEMAAKTYGRSLQELPEDVRRSFYGKRVIDVAALVVERLGLDISPQRWADERLEIFMDLVEKGIGLMPGLESSLDLFRSHGLKTAVVSSGVRRYVDRILESTGMASRFDAVVTGDDVTRGKPDPQCFLTAARKIGAEPGACLVLEDAHAGILAGKAAGMKVVAVRNRFSLDYTGADLVIDSLAQIDHQTLERLSDGLNPADLS
ncbi:MAG TPA: HAD family phosphatase [Candidatus Glassbacteria bacterium]|nr:HAD family phosphatase [Candidatus Glassbacteria bacterium]